MPAWFVITTSKNPEVCAALQSSKIPEMNWNSTELFTYPWSTLTTPSRSRKRALRFIFSLTDEFSLSPLVIFRNSDVDEVGGSSVSIRTQPLHIWHQEIALEREGRSCLKIVK